MKKGIVLIFALAVMLSLPAVTSADITASQTITLTVPEAPTLTPTVKMTLPSLGTALNGLEAWAYEQNAEYTVSEITAVKKTSSISATAFEEGQYTITFRVDITGNYVFSDAAATVLSTADYNVTYPAARIEIGNGGKTAKYSFTYEIVPSWTMTIPADTAAVYDANGAEISFGTIAIGDLRNVPEDRMITVSFSHTGILEKTTDSSRTVPFVVRSGTKRYSADTPHQIFTKKFQSGIWTDVRETPSVTIFIPAEDLTAAGPGDYRTTFTYSSTQSAVY